MRAKFDAVKKLHNDIKITLPFIKEWKTKSTGRKLENKCDISFSMLALLALSYAPNAWNGIQVLMCNLVFTH